MWVVISNEMCSENRKMFSPVAGSWLASGTNIFAIQCFAIILKPDEWTLLVHSKKTPTFIMFSLREDF